MAQLAGIEGSIKVGKKGQKKRKQEPQKQRKRNRGTATHEGALEKRRREREEQEEQRQAMRERNVEVLLRERDGGESKRSRSVLERLKGQSRVHVVPDPVPKNHDGLVSDDDIEKEDNEEEELPTELPSLSSLAQKDESDEPFEVYKFPDAE